MNIKRMIKNATFAAVAFAGVAFMSAEKADAQVQLSGNRGAISIGGGHHGHRGVSISINPGHGDRYYRPSYRPPTCGTYPGYRNPIWGAPAHLGYHRPGGHYNVPGNRHWNR